MKNCHTKNNLVWKINILENICIVLILIIKNPSFKKANLKKIKEVCIIGLYLINWRYFLTDQ